MLRESRYTAAIGLIFFLLSTIGCRHPSSETQTLVGYDAVTLYRLAVMQDFPQAAE